MKMLLTISQDKNVDEGIFNKCDWINNCFSTNIE